MAIWDTDLHEASLGGVTFPVAKRSIKGGRAVARRRYPHRDGQDTQDGGREPYAFDLEIPLFANVDPAHYPTVYEQLRNVCDDPETQGELEYVDPELGPLQVTVIDWNWAEEAGARDGGTFTLKLEERSFEEIVFSINTLVSATDARSLAQGVDDALADAGVPKADIEAAWRVEGLAIDWEGADDALFASMSDAFFENLNDSAFAADELASVIDDIRFRIDLTLGLDAVSEDWTVFQALIRLGDALTRAGEEVVSSRPAIIEWTVPVVMDVWSIAIELYGDTERSDEILRRNPTENPLFYARGRVLLVEAA